MRHRWKRLRRAVERIVRALRGKSMVEPWFDVRSGLSLELGRTLVHWSDNAISHPPDVDFDEWKSLLRTHGQALLVYGSDDNDDDPEVTQAAKAALHWVADNLPTMWD